MKKKNFVPWIIIGICILVIATVFYFVRWYEPLTRVCFPNGCILAEEVRDGSAKEQGLMWRTELGEERGMLFVWDTSGVYPFWMKNTLIPLDMIWIDETKRVVSIRENAQPCKIDPCEVIMPGGRARYVLEVNAGKVSQLSIRIGDAVTF
jgi:uncharacterized protein